MISFDYLTEYAVSTKYIHHKKYCCNNFDFLNSDLNIVSRLLGCGNLGAPEYPPNSGS